jgi:hypothetical protein
VTKLRISEDLALPIDAVTSTLIIYGGKGMGKTNFGSVLIEELNRAGLRWSVLDPLGVWWGLRHSKDGKGPGIQCLILGGVRGDIPIEPTAGAVAADLVVDEDASVIIDFSRKPSGEMWSVGEKIRFVTDYTHRLFQRQGELIDGRRREPIFQILDEAARYIPQVIPSGSLDLAKCVGAWEQLVEEGRNIGIGVGLLTQRSARMNKSVSEVADAIFSFRIVGPRSIDAIVDWLGEHVEKERIKGLVQTIRSLDVGRCLLVSPGWLKFEGVITIRGRETFDSSATPKPGERAKRVTGKAATPDLAKYAERMKATIEKAKESDPRELKARIKKLQAELATTKQVVLQQTKSVAQPADERVLKNAVHDAVLQTLAVRDEDWMRAIRDYQIGLNKRVLDSLGTIAATIERYPFRQPKHISKLSVEVLKKPATGEVSPRAIPQGISGKTNPVAAREETPELSSGKGEAPAHSNGEVTRPQMRILAELAMFESLRISPVPKKMLAAASGVSHSSSGYDKNLSTLRTKGLIDYPGPGMIALSDAGRAVAPHPDTPVDPQAMLERCREVTSGPQFRILEELFAAYPEAMDRTTLAEKVRQSETSSGYDKNLSTLRTAGMIEYPAQGQVKAANWLYLE